MADLSLEPTVDRDRCLIVVAGEIDAQTAPLLVAEVGRGLDDPAVRRVVADLAQVTFLDSTGIAALVRLRNKALDTGKQLALRTPGPRVEKVLKITALDTVFEIERATG
ncbi:MAG: anti-sigma factor antagonist [Pseudonocardiales bacterium]|nr:anti-sigma factor antagonist [Pseudonocardiales bacterium]